MKGNMVHMHIKVHTTPEQRTLEPEEPLASSMSIVYALTEQIEGEFECTKSGEYILRFTP